MKKVLFLFLAFPFALFAQEITFTPHPEPVDTAFMEKIFFLDVEILL